MHLLNKLFFFTCFAHSSTDPIQSRCRKKKYCLGPSSSWKASVFSTVVLSVGTRVHDGRDPNPELPNMGLWMGYYLVYYYQLPLGGIQVVEWQYSTTDCCISIYHYYYYYLPSLQVPSVDNLKNAQSDSKRSLLFLGCTDRGINYPFPNCFHALSRERAFVLITQQDMSPVH